MSDIPQPSDFPLRRALDRVKSELRGTTIAVAAVSLVAVSLVFLLAVVAADHLLEHGLPLGVRRALLVLWALGAAAWVFVFAIRPLVRSISDVYAAWLIERRHPELLNALTTAVQLGDDPSLPAAVRASLLRRAQARAADLPAESLSDTRPLKRGLWSLPLILAAFLIFAFLSPRSIWPSLARALGDSDTAVPPRTWFTSISPAETDEFSGSYPDAKLAPFDPKRPRSLGTAVAGGSVPVAGDVIEFVADLAGSRPASVKVRWGAEKGAYTVENELGLTFSGVVLDGARLVGRWRGRFYAPAAPVWFRVVAGEAASEDRRLNVAPVPLVSAVTAEVHSPAYVDRPVRRHDFSREDLNDRRGSTVDLRVTTNTFAQTAALIFDDGRREPLRPVNAGGTEWSGGITLESTTAFRVEFQDRRLRSNRDAGRLYRVQVRADVPPLVELLSPAGDVALPIDGALNLRVSVADDLGLTRVSLVYQRLKGPAAAFTQGPAEAFKLFVQPRGTESAQRKWSGPSAPIAIKDLRVKVGDVLLCRVEAFDNAEPDAQKGESREFRLTVVPPGALGEGAGDGKAGAKKKSDKPGADGGGDKSDKGSGNGAGKNDKDGSQGDSKSGMGDGKSDSKNDPNEGKSKTGGGDSKEKKGENEKDTGDRKNKGSPEEEKKDPSDKGRDGSRAAKETKAEGKKGGGGGNKEPDPRPGAREGSDGAGAKSDQPPDGGGKPKAGEAETPDGGTAADADELAKALALAQGQSTKGSDDPRGPINEKLEGKTNKIGAFERDALKKEGGARTGDMGGTKSRPGKDDRTPAGKSTAGDGAAEHGGDGKAEKDDGKPGKAGAPGAGNSASNKTPEEGKPKSKGAAGDEGAGSEKTPTKRSDTPAKAKDADKGYKPPDDGKAGSVGGPAGDRGRGGDPKAGPEGDRLKSDPLGELKKPEIDPAALKRAPKEGDDIRTLGQVVKTLHDALDRKQLDPKLLADLGWNENDVRTFIRKYEGKFNDGKLISGAVRDRAGKIGREKTGPARVDPGGAARVGGGAAAVKRDADTVRRTTQQRLEQFDKKYQDFLNDFYNSVE